MVDCLAIFPLMRTCTSLDQSSCEFSFDLMAVILAKVLFFTAIVTWGVRARATKVCNDIPASTPDVLPRGRQRR